jgi:hypothetical protein
MNTLTTIRTLTRQRWREVQPLILPPAVPVVLWTDETRTIYVDEALGPAVPYQPVLRTDSESNYGYIRLKGRLDLVSAIPELIDWPEYRQLVGDINLVESPIESVGCAIGMFPVSDQPAITCRVGSYLDLVFSDAAEAEDPIAHLDLAAQFMASVSGCERWWSSVEIGLQRLKHLPSTAAPLGLTMRLSAHGRTEAEARQCFAVTINRVRNAIPGTTPRTAA